MKWTDRLRAAQTRESAALTQSAAAVEHTNRRMFLLVLTIGVCLFGTLLVLTFLLKDFRSFRLTDAVIVVAFAALFLVSRLPSMNAPAALWLYCSFFIYAVVTILSGIFVAQDYLDVMIIVCLFQLPVLTLDHSWRVNAVELVLTVTYLLIVTPHLPAGDADKEIVTVLSVTATAMAAGGFLRRGRLENFELERESALRETTDYLTGLYNRRKLFEYLGEKEKKNGPAPITGMLMLDIDFFKLYNDSYGHVAGDDCLRRIGAYLLSLPQSYPVNFFRYGGEEFLGTCHDFNAEELACFCEKIVDDVSRMNIRNDSVERGRVTVSIGLTTAGSPGSGSYEQMISEADSALYEAKRTGRDRAVVWRPGMSAAETPSFH